MYKLFLVVTSLIGSIVLLEFGLRFSNAQLGNLQAMPIHWIMTDPEWTIDPDLIFAHIPVLDAIEQRATSSGNLPLVLGLGDSFTAGEPFPDEVGFLNQMQSLLAREGIRIDILNTGSSGYSPDQELIILRRVLAKGIRPKIVVWSFYVNDFYESAQTPSFTIAVAGTLLQLDGRKNFVFQRQQFFRALPLPQQIKEKSALVAALLHFYNLKIGHQLPPELRDPDTSTDWVIKKFQLQIQEAKQLSVQYGFTIIPVLIYPQTTYLSADYLKEHQIYDDAAEVGMLNQLLSQDQHYIPLHFITLLEDKGLRAKENHDATGASTYFISQDSELERFPLGQHHFNPLGYALFGEVVAAKVRSLLLMP